MKFVQIFMWHVVLFGLCAALLDSDKCKKRFDRTFTISSTYYRSLLRNCERVAKAKELSAQADAEEDMKIMTSVAFQDCYRLQQCDHSPTESEAYDCLVKQTWEAFQMLNDVSFKASEYSFELINEYREISEEKYKCTNDTDRRMTSDTFVAVSELIKCNNNAML